MTFPDFDAAAFLRDHWQKQPLLIRNPWARWHNPLEPDELAGLACEEGVESRLIVQSGGDQREGWTVEHGPLPEDRFATLGRDPWTLLVQAVDHHAPQVAALLPPFRFIPNWRVDDIMVSYATDGGGVGPHFDQYDVFLIQGLGRRRWRLGQRCDADTPLLAHGDLKLLAHFDVESEWVLEPGDILYVPPGLAHDGIAVGDDCMTYSIGFRAPARSELIADWADDVLERLVEDDRYADPDLPLRDNPGEIADAELERLHAMMLEAMGDRRAFARWFGRYNSLSKYAEADWRPDEVPTPNAVRQGLKAGNALCRNPASRFTFVREDDALLLFVDGQCHECAGDVAAVAERLCAADMVDAGWPLSDQAVELIVTLMTQGSVAFED